MLGDGGSQKEALRPDFDRSILVDFRGARISSDTDFLLLREMDERFDIIDPKSDCLEDRRSAVHTRHSLVQMIRQRVYQIAAGYEDCKEILSFSLDRFGGVRSRCPRGYLFADFMDFMDFLAGGTTEEEN